MSRENKSMKQLAATAKELAGGSGDTPGVLGVLGRGFWGHET